MRLYEMKILTAFILLLSFYSSATFAQQDRWHIVSTFSDPNDIYFDPWFLNEKYGFVSMQGGRGTLWRTDDSAKTWTQVTNDTYPSGTFVGWIYNLFYLTPSHLYLSIDVSAPFKIFESTDSGKYWKMLCNAPSRDIYVNNGVLYVAGFSSNDNGATWQSVLPPTSKAIIEDDIAGNRDSCIDMSGTGSGSQTDNYDRGSLYTTDMGKTWNDGPIDLSQDEEYAVPYRPIFFRSVINYDSGYVLRSTNGAKSWQKVHVDRLNAGGIDGAGCAVYAQRWFDEPTSALVGRGIIRSTDLGDTWHDIGGHAGFISHRISVTSGGAVCYANDSRGNLWKYVDSSMLVPIRNRVRVKRIGAAEQNDTLFLAANQAKQFYFKVELPTGDHGFLLSVDATSEALTSEVSCKREQVMIDTRAAKFDLLLQGLHVGTHTLTLRLTINRSDRLPEDVEVTYPVVVSDEKEDTL
jgi:hypothetical protein